MESVRMRQNGSQISNAHVLSFCLADCMPKLLHENNWSFEHYSLHLQTQKSCKEAQGKAEFKESGRTGIQGNFMNCMRTLSQLCTVSQLSTELT